MLPSRTFHPHQYVKASIAPNKTEIGLVVSTNAEKLTAVIETRGGYNLEVSLAQLQRGFLLILDLNGVLGARQGNAKFVHRPHLDEFLKFALTNFVVGVWTSCEERNGVVIVDDVFADYRDRLLFLSYRNDCTPRPTIEKPYGTFKNLQQIFDRWPDSFHAANTVIVDDSPDKCSHPDIALCPKPYDGTQADDDGLLETIETLKQVLREDSVHPLIAAAEERRRRMEEEDLRTRNTGMPPHTLRETLRSVLERDSMERLPGSDVHRIKSRTKLCCLFTQGKCRFGERCRFSHTDDGKQHCDKGGRCYAGHRQRQGDLINTGLISPPAAIDVSDVVDEGRGSDEQNVTALFARAQRMSGLVSSQNGGIDIMATIVRQRLHSQSYSQLSMLERALNVAPPSGGVISEQSTEPSVVSILQKAQRIQK